MSSLFCIYLYQTNNKNKMITFFIIIALAILTSVLVTRLIIGKDNPSEKSIDLAETLFPKEDIHVEIAKTVETIKAQDPIVAEAPVEAAKPKKKAAPKKTAPKATAPKMKSTPKKKNA